VVTEDDDAAPEQSAVLADSVGLALMVVLDTLSPDERLAFVLHDMFAVPFTEIGQIIGKSTDAAKMLASRARRKVQGRPRPAADLQQQREVVDAFLAAARDGDFDGLLRVLDPDVTWRAVMARGKVVKLGATQVLAAVQHGRRAAIVARRVLVNGEPGILVWSKGKPVTLMACTVVDGRIVDVLALLDPTRLAAMDLPKPPQSEETPDGEQAVR
jgi:RNA polymerase sigma-70 factor (ECF subfamily)